MTLDSREQEATSSAKAQGRGIALMLLCTFCFATMDGISKLLIVRYPVGEIMFIRYAFFLVLILALARPRNLATRLAARRPWYQVLRAVVLVADQVLFVLGLSYLALADAHVLISVTPLMVAALSVPLLAESVGRRRWAAIAVGFFGVVFVLQPEGGLFRPAALFPLGAAVLFALYQIMTRVVSRTDSQEATLLYTALVGALTFGLAAPFGWVTPDAQGAVLLAALAVVGCAAHVSLIKALTLAPAAVLQPFFYMTLVWAIAIGYLVFDAVPATTTLAGAAAIAGAGLYTLHRERISKKRRDRRQRGL